MDPTTSRFCTGPSCSRPGQATEQLDGLIAGDARMAHVSPGPYLPLDSAPMLVGDISTLADHIRPVSGRPMTFTVSQIIRPAEARSLELVPFFRVHDSRYMIYWRAVAPDQVQRRRRPARSRGKGATCPRGPNDRSRDARRAAAGSRAPRSQRRLDDRCDERSHLARRQRLVQLRPQARRC